MTSCPCHSNDPGGDVAEPGDVDGPLIGTRPPAVPGHRAGLLVTWVPGIDVGSVTVRSGTKGALHGPTYAVFCGIDVGKGEHHAVGLDPAGTRLFDKACPTTRPNSALCSTAWPNTARCW